MIKLIKKFWKLGISFTLMMLLTSCNLLSNNIENMILPPNHSNDFNSITETIKQANDKDIVLKYPKSGDYKTAISLVNIDDDDGMEAIAFYTIPSTNNETFTLRISILDIVKDKWEVTYNLGVEAKAVEKLDIVKTKTKKYIAIGFVTAGLNNKELVFYEYEQNQLIKRDSFKCTEYVIMDIDLDNVSEVIEITTKQIDDNRKVGFASSIKISDEGFKVSSTIKLDPRVREYINVAKTQLYVGRPALYLDGVREDGTVTTQILAHNNIDIENLMYKPNSRNNLTDKTVRNTKTICQDIDGDNIYEIPTFKPFYGYEYVDDHNKIYTTVWNVYSLGEIKEKYVTYSDFSLNFYFVLPDSFIREVSVWKNVSQNLITFSQQNKIDPNRADEIFSIQVVKRSDFESLKSDRRFKVLETRGHLVYMYYIYDNNTSITVTPQEIKERFKIFAAQ